jgi:endonuclease/exonuclease/phosphatase family metal-dependent hydrolase
VRLFLLILVCAAGCEVESTVDSRGPAALLDAGLDPVEEADANVEEGAADFPVEVLHYNVGNGAGRAGQNDVIRWLEQGERPAVITLNELCGARFHQIEEVAGPAGYAGFFFATNPDGCGGSNGGLGYGNAVFVRGEVLEEPSLHPYVVQEPHAETRNIGCAKFTLPGGSAVAACVTHLENNHRYADDQAGEALDRAIALRAEVDGGRVVVGGDFNLEPDHSSVQEWIESPFDAVGLGLETHDSGKAIDYVFATRSADSNDARTETGESDHRAVWATIWNY